MNNIETVVGLALIDDVEEKVLLQLRDNKPEIADPNIWVLPGGRVEDNEPLQKAIKREFVEETGYLLVHPKLFFALTLLEHYGRKKILYFFYEFYDFSQKINCYEGQRVEFVKYDSLAAIQTPEYLKTVIKIIKKSKAFNGITSFEDAEILSA